jgi:hypothetical protein
VATSGPPRLGRDHRLRGPRDVAFLRTGIVVRDVTVDVGAGSAVVTIFNGSGHRLPTAEPQRRVELTLDALGPRGEVLESSSENLQRVILLPALTEVSDSTLLPRETRSVTLRIPPEGATTLRVRITYHLWDPEHVVARIARIPAADLRVEVYERVWDVTARGLR